jgi:hypothetical protein
MGIGSLTAGVLVVVSLSLAYPLKLGLRLESLRGPRLNCVSSLCPL